MVIGTAFTALVTKFTDSVIEPLINRVGASRQSNVGILRIGIGDGQAIDLNIVLSAAINFVLIAAVVYFPVVVPYNTLRKRGEFEPTDDAQIALLSEIRDILAVTNGSLSGKRPTAAGETEPSRAAGAERDRSPVRPCRPQISRLDNWPMMCVASGFSVAMPSRTA